MGTAQKVEEVGSGSVVVVAVLGGGGVEDKVEVVRVSVTELPEVCLTVGRETDRSSETKVIFIVTK